MKRHGNLYDRIISVENLELADTNARKGKSNQPCIKRHDDNSEENILRLSYLLKNKLFKTSKYTTFIIKEPKERVIYRLPYYPDRIVQHAIMNVTKPIFVSTFTADTYSCIKKRGTHKAVIQVKKALTNHVDTKYYLKIDIQKFYPNVNHSILKQMLRRKFKDKNLLELLDEIIDSAQGLPIGNYLSQYLANFYLAYFDHWVKEVQNVVYYFRYADDMVFFSRCKIFLHKLLDSVKTYLWVNLRLKVKGNHKVAPITEGLDFLGYVFFPDYTLIRKRIKQNFARMLKHNPNRASIMSYLGLLSHANCINLKNKLLYAYAKH